MKKKAVATDILMLQEVRKKAVIALVIMSNTLQITNNRGLLLKFIAVTSGFHIERGSLSGAQIAC